MSTDELVAQHLCNNSGQDTPNCLEIADHQYTMDYTDIEGGEGGGYVRWCSNCGPSAHELEAKLYQLLEDPVFEKDFKEALDKVKPS